MGQNVRFWGVPLLPSKVGEYRVTRFERPCNDEKSLYIYIYIFDMSVESAEKILEKNSETSEASLDTRFEICTTDRLTVFQSRR